MLQDKRRRKMLLAVGLLVLLLAQTLGMGPLPLLDTPRSRLVSAWDLGGSRVGLWLGGGLWPVLELHDSRR
jgi:hypothetical protein